jgi:hypothetical protein
MDSALLIVVFGNFANIRSSQLAAWTVEQEIANIAAAPRVERAIEARSTI